MLPGAARERVDFSEIFRNVLFFSAIPSFSTRSLLCGLIVRITKIIPEFIKPSEQDALERE